jgi:hypothetical protein
MMDRLNRYLSADLHNYTVCALLLLYAATVLAVLLWPQDTRLAMAKDVGTALMGVIGIVAGAHSSKVIAGIHRNDPAVAGKPSVDDAK